MIAKSSLFRSVPHRPLLKSVLPIDIVETNATSKMNGSTRVEATINCLVRFLEAASFSQPIVILIDDVQWLDANSVKLIDALRSLHRILIVGTSRVHEGDDDSSVGQFLSSARKVKLQPLTPEESKALLLAAFRIEGELVSLRLSFFVSLSIPLSPSLALSLPLPLSLFSSISSEIELTHLFSSKEIDEHIVHFCHERAEGIPFVLRSMLQTLLEAELCVINDNRALVLDKGKVSSPEQLQSLETPDTVRDLIRTRVSKLDPSCLSALFIAATIGRHFDLRQLDDACRKTNAHNKMAKHVKILMDAKVLVVDRSAEKGKRRWVLGKGAQGDRDGDGVMN